MPALDDPEALPFAPGTSPFHLKGIVYRRHVEYAEAHIPGGVRAVNAELASPTLREFFEQHFLASSWYDALPIVPVWYAAARVLRQSPGEFLKARTRHQAQHDIHGVYRFLLKLASAEAVAMRMPRALQQYFNFGETQVHVVRPDVVHIEHGGIPAIMAPWFSVVGETYLAVALEISGVEGARIRRQPARSGGTAHGTPLVSLSLEVSLKNVPE